MRERRAGDRLDVVRDDEVAAVERRPRTRELEDRERPARARPDLDAPGLPRRADDVDDVAADGSETWTSSSARCIATQRLAVDDRVELDVVRRGGRAAARGSPTRPRATGSRPRSAAGSGRAAPRAGGRCPRARSGSGSRARGTAARAGGVWPSVVTWRSCIASSSAACVFGGARLISSARRRLAKIGPGRNSNVGGALVVDRGAGHVGGHQVRRELDAAEVAGSVACANERAISVFARPGKSSIRTWPSASSPSRTSSSASRLPTTARSTSSRSGARARRRPRSTVHRRFERVDDGARSASRGSRARRGRAAAAGRAGRASHASGPSSSSARCSGRSRSTPRRRRRCAGDARAPSGAAGSGVERRLGRQRDLALELGELARPRLRRRARAAAASSRVGRSAGSRRASRREHGAAGRAPPTTSSQTSTASAALARQKIASAIAETGVASTDQERRTSAQRIRTALPELVAERPRASIASSFIAASIACGLNFARSNSAVSRSTEPAPAPTGRQDPAEVLARRLGRSAREARVARAPAPSRVGGDHRRRGSGSARRSSSESLERGGELGASAAAPSPSDLLRRPAATGSRRPRRGRRRDDADDDSTGPQSKSRRAAAVGRCFSVDGPRPASATGCLACAPVQRGDHREDDRDGAPPPRRACATQFLRGRRAASPSLLARGHEQADAGEDRPRRARRRRGGAGTRDSMSVETVRVEPPPAGAWARLASATIAISPRSAPADHDRPAREAAAHRAIVRLQALGEVRARADGPAAPRAPPSANAAAKLGSDAVKSIGAGSVVDEAAATSPAPAARATGRGRSRRARRRSLRAHRGAVRRSSRACSACRRAASRRSARRAAGTKNEPSRKRNVGSRERSRTSAPAVATAALDDDQQPLRDARATRSGARPRSSRRSRTPRRSRPPSPRAARAPRRRRRRRPRPAAAAGRRCARARGRAGAERMEPDVGTR